LPTRMGVMMSRSSDSRPVPSLMKWPFGSSRGWSLQQVRDEHPSPLWGLDRHPTDRSRAGWPLDVIGLLDGELWA